MGLRLFVSNARTATGNFSNAVDLTVYFRAGVSLDKAQQLARSARSRPGIADLTLVPSDKALEEFRKYSGFGAAMEALPGNPLPHVLVIHPDSDHDSPLQLEVLKRYFTAWPEVELVQMDTEWVQRFSAILDVLRTLVGVAALVLAAGVLAVIGNTIRLEILNRRAEIEVTKLVGGSNAFVRRPFLYTGVLYGLIGALLRLGHYCDGDRRPGRAGRNARAAVWQPLRVAEPVDRRPRTASGNRPAARLAGCLGVGSAAARGYRASGLA